MLNIFLFELKYRVGRPATWAYFGLLLVFGFILAANGANSLSEKAFANSPVVVTNLIAVVSIFGALLASAVMGVPVYRDIEHGVKNYYFTYPVSERDYLLGRYLGSLLTLLFISLGFVVGLWLGYGLGPALGWEEAERFGPFQAGAYARGVLYLLWPNLIFTGTLFFCAVALTRKIFVSYVGSVLFFILYLVASTLASDIDNQGVASLLDPFGVRAFAEATRYLTPPEQNAFVLGLDGNLGWNRLLILGLTALMLAGTLLRFSFVRFLEAAKAKAKVKRGADAGAGLSHEAKGSSDAVPVPAVSQSFTTAGYLTRMRSQAWIEFKSIVRDPFFFGIVGGALLFLLLDGYFGNTTYGTQNLPTTYFMLEAKDGTFTFFVFIILVFYTGEVVHRDRSVKFDQISDALPVPNWAIYGGKLLTMVMVCLALATMPLIIGVISQTAQGYFDYNFGQYFTELYVLTFPQYLVWMSLAFFVHVLINSKFLGHVVAIGTYAALFFIPGVLEVDYNMFLFGLRPAYVISEMNDFGHFVPAISWFNGYWLAFGGVLIVLGGLFFARGTDNAWRSRFQRFGQDWGWRPAAAIGVLLLAFVGSGFVIHRNVSVRNTYLTSEESLDLREGFERKYRRYLGFPQPKITAVDVAVDLMPEDRDVFARGVFTLVNKTAEPIDTILLNRSYGEEIARLQVFTINGRSPATVRLEPAYNFGVYHLATPLAPGDTAEMVMRVELDYGAFPNEGLQRDVVHNGTFLNSSIFPNFGYSGQGEIGSDVERRKRGLPIRDYSLPPADDPAGQRNLLFEDDADFVTFRAVVSTAPDQIAIAPGKLTREYERDGRRYFEYVNESPIQNFYNISSARYAVTERTWENSNGRDVKLQIFHHDRHDRNVGRFLDAAELSLAYYSEHFSPYQFDQLRILEFPRYANFAQSFPNTVPYSEGFGWTGDFSDPGDNDYAFTVTAHEVAHQWWGHQIAPSATRGANQISESMAEYSSLMVTRERYGEAAMKEFLKYELDRYLRSRAGESKFEKTLLDNDTQSYVWYRKGGLILYALQDYVGEERLNAGFAAMLDSFALKAEPPFATSRDWYGFIQDVTPDSLRYFLTESFEEITLYENKAVSASYNTRPDADGKYRVTLTVDTRKIKYAGSGEELSRPDERSLIEIGVFGADGTNDQGLPEMTPLYLQKTWLTPGEHTLELRVDEPPVKAGIDPYNKLIDRISDDNLTDVDAE